MAAEHPRKQPDGGSPESMATAGRLGPHNGAHRSRGGGAELAHHHVRVGCAAAARTPGYKAAL